MTDGDHPRALRSSVGGDRVSLENESWQRSDFGNGGRYAGRMYYDGRTNPPQDDRADRDSMPGGSGRILSVLGLIVALTGAAGWLWLILAFVSAVGAGTVADHPIGTRVGGIPLGSGGFLAITTGILLVLAGNWLSRAARSRYYRVKTDPTRSI